LNPIAASSAGTLIEWYDFYIFGSLATIISAQFFPKGHETAAICYLPIYKTMEANACIELRYTNVGIPRLNSGDLCNDGERCLWGIGSIYRNGPG
jgi:hypothetical protein